MKIVIIHNHIQPYIFGGASINVENFAYCLAGMGVEVILVTTGENKEMEVSFPGPNLKVYRFFPLNLYFNYPERVKRSRLIKVLWWLFNLWNPFVFITVRYILKKEKPDLVNIRCFYGLSPSVFTAARIRKIPIVYTAHDFSSLCWNGHFIKKGKVCQKRCILCFIWTNWNKNFMNNINFHFLSFFSEITVKRYFKVKNSITHHNCTYLSKKEIGFNISFREEKQLNLDFIRFIYIGSLTEYKGILTLLEAFSKTKIRNIELLIGGDGELEEKVIDYTKKDTRIRYFGFVSGETKRGIFLNGDVFVLPSQWYEVSPLVIQEAYAYGLPVIGTEFGSIPEHIEENETGWLFPYKDVDALAKKIEEIGVDREGIIKSSRKCFEKALGNTRDKYVERIMRDFKSACL